jgi:hypothetical protein
VSIEETPHGIWTCKVGEAGVLSESGLDFPMRQAVAAAFKEITGSEPDYIFSGWRGELTEPERAVVENRLPDYSASNEDLAARLVRAVRSADASPAFYKDEKIDATAAVLAILNAERPA